MGRRLCKGSALVEAVVKSGFKGLFGAALLRHGRSEQLFAIVGDNEGLKAVTYNVESVKPDRIVLKKKRVCRDQEIAGWFRKVHNKKQSYEWMDMDENDLRYLASRVFPGSLFYDMFINPDMHIFEALPPPSSDLLTVMETPKKVPTAKDSAVAKASAMA